MASFKSDRRGRPFQETLVLAVCASLVTAIVVSFLNSVNRVPNTTGTNLRQLELLSDGFQPLDRPKRLLFYNRPPKTGSTSVRVAMKNALVEKNLTAAHCFNMIEWNEMALRTIVNRRDVDFYGCHTRLDKERFASIAGMRGGNVTFMTSTRDPSGIIFSSYMQRNRARDVAGITDKEEMAKELELYKKHVSEYEISALYAYHGAEVPLTECPYEFRHENAMRRIAERYEIVVDLERPKESAALVEIVTGMKPNFELHYNERTQDLSSPMLAALAKIDTSSRACGNALVHKVLMQQFNVIKDRLMQNRCFNEDQGSFELCDKDPLHVAKVMERTRLQSFRARKQLRERSEEK